MVNFGRLDLNLLLTLDVLLTEQNVTRAAEHLHLSQPSVSVHLSKLREVFDDPLLLPGPRGMRPTARAEELRGPLRQALDTLQRAISPAGPFDPAQARRTWKIAASDLTASTTLLPALASLRRAAPDSRLAVLQIVPSRIARQVEQGEIDLAFHISEEIPEGLHHQALFTERYVLAGRTGHPALRKSPTLRQFCKLDHVIVSPDGGGFAGATDRALAEADLSRRVVLSVPHFLILRSILATTDLVSLLPLHLVRRWSELKVFKPPIEIPGYEMSMLWHERVHRDPAHQWLREHIVFSLKNEQL